MDQKEKIQEKRKRNQSETKDTKKRDQSSFSKIQKKRNGNQ